MSCTRASRFLDAHQIEAKEVVPASRKLGRKDAAEIAAQASRVIVAKGGKVQVFAGGKAGKHAIDAMLGPTGNLRAPTLRRGKLVVVGFDEETFARELA
jgi:arsenate reductase-like glutaredoxin family protein